jgi:hypothetical protein
VSTGECSDIYIYMYVSLTLSVLVRELHTSVIGRPDIWNQTGFLVILKKFESKRVRYQLNMTFVKGKVGPRLAFFFFPFFCLYHGMRHFSYGGV